MSTTASLDPSRSVLEAGREGTATLFVRNDSDIVEEYSFQEVGDTAEWTRIDPPQITVYPGQSATAVVTFKPPRSSAVPAGENPYGIHVQPAKRAENATVPEGVLEVLPFYDTVAELAPQTAKGKGAEQYRISVANRGNAPVAVALAGKSTSEGLELGLAQERQTVGPGTTWISQLRAQPTERLWRGTPVAYPFTVLAMPAEGPQIALAGTQYQEPILPGWLPKALLAVLALVVITVAGFLLRPAAVQVWERIFAPDPTPTTAEPTAAGPTEEQPTEEQPTEEQPTEEQPTVAGPTAEPTVAGPTEEQPTAEQPTEEQPTEATPTPTPTVPSTPGEIELTAVPGGYDIERWPAAPWAGTVEVESIVVRNPQGDAGPFSVEVLAPDGLPVSDSTWQLADLADDQELVSQAEAATPEASPTSLSTVELLEPFSITADQAFRLAMTCNAVGTDLVPEPTECSVTIEVNGEVIAPQELE
jgi:hypothetical protein